MKSLKTIALAGLMLAVATPVMAGPGHDHGHGHSHAMPAEMSKADALEAASGAIDALIQQQYEVEGAVLGNEWRTVTNNHKEIVTDTGDYIIVGVKHPTESKKLYLLFSKAGELFDANFSGQFEGLE